MKLPISLITAIVCAFAIVSLCVLGYYYYEQHQEDVLGQRQYIVEHERVSEQLALSKKEYASLMNEAANYRQKIYKLDTELEKSKKAVLALRNNVRDVKLEEIAKSLECGEGRNSVIEFNSKKKGIALTEDNARCVDNGLEELGLLRTQLATYDQSIVQRDNEIASLRAADMRIRESLKFSQDLEKITFQRFEDAEMKYKKERRKKILWGAVGTLVGAGLGAGIVAIAQ